MKNKIIKVSSLVIIFLLLISVFTGCGEEKKAAIAAYDKEVQRINTEISSLQNEIKISEELISSGKKPYEEEKLTTLEKVITDASSSIKEIPEQPIKADEINALVNDTLKNVSYVETTQKVTEAKAALEKSIKIMEQVTNPSEDFIVNCLKDIKGITGCDAVTEDHDPNGNLNKAGGYTSTVYFAYNKVDKSNLVENNIIDNGTDGGGSLEVYANEEDANKRNDSLAAFDGSILASGSHKVVGTILVRTSNYLTASQQKELEAAIVENLTTLAE